jgi:DNA-binding LacI/PurR family transcriptional regulator
VSKERTTIADVARAVGVSKGLVSFALNDRPGVSPETRQRILEEAARLGWRPSVRARSLSTDRAFAVGLVIARAPEVIADDPFFPSFIAGLESRLRVDTSLVLRMASSSELEVGAYRSLAQDGRVDGVILTDLRQEDSRLRLVDDLRLPAVTLGRPDVESASPAVCLDDGAGVREVVDHLIGLGHRHIAYVAGPQRMLHGVRRRRATEAAIAEHGLGPATVLETDFSAADGAWATEELLHQDPRPTAIIYANDPMAIAGIGVAQRAGLRVPEDLSVTGFDGSEVGGYLNPSLTTVTTAIQDWGAAAADALLRHVAGEPVDDIDLAPARLVVRESTAEAPERTA